MLNCFQKYEIQTPKAHRFCNLMFQLAVFIMWKDFKLGLRSYLDAIVFIYKHHFWIYFIIPIIVFISIYYLGFYFRDLTTIYKTPNDASFFKSVYYFFVSGVFLLLSFMFLNFIRYIIILLISPLLSIVSERTERILTNKNYNYSFSQLIKDIKRALNLIFRNIFWEMLLGLCVVIVLMILKSIFNIHESIISIIQSLIISFIAFYYYGFGFIDYIMERLQMNHKESIKFVRKHRGLAIALGFIFTPLFHYSNNYLFILKEQFEPGSIYFLIILILSVTLIAIIPIVSMVAATIAVHELIDLNKNSNSNHSH